MELVGKAGKALATAGHWSRIGSPVPTPTLWFLCVTFRSQMEPGSRRPKW